jgi:phosphoserine aminotransferase
MTVSFSSGPCGKRPKWNVDVLGDALVGMSHRSQICKDRVKEVISLQKEILKLPQDFKIGIIMGSDTAAIESAFWNLLGLNGVDIINFDVFGNRWSNDIINNLKIKDVREFKSNIGEIPNLDSISCDRDIVFCFNGTTSGTFLDLDFIKKDRKGLVFCDATSGAFAYEIDWDKIDILTYSWQKVLGGEAGHGVVILSPRAIKRLNEYTPTWPIPYFMNLKHKDVFVEGITINTLSMLCVEDLKDALLWAKNNGGLDFLIKKTEENSNYLYNFLDNSKYLTPLCKDKKYRSKTSVTFAFKENNTDERLKTIVDSMSKYGFCDIKGHRDAPTSFRIWCGPTVEIENLKNFCKKLEELLSSL